MEGKPISSLSLIFLSLPSLDSSLVNQESKEEKEERERRLTDRFLGSDGNQDSFLFFFLFLVISGKLSTVSLSLSLRDPNDTSKDKKEMNLGEVETGG